MLKLEDLAKKLTLTHERKRTQREPIWQGFESNLIGYDVLSVVDKRNNNLLLIEVKTSDTAQKLASFHISENEWQVSISSRNYIFHLWSLKPKPDLIIISPDQLEPHIPNNNGEGKWESAIIPFEVFT